MKLEAVFVVLFLIVGTNAKTCLEQVKELSSSPPLLGAFKPVCQSNGMFAETQCHAGYCYCVVPSTGEEILGTRVRFNRPKTCKATPCFMQRSEGLLKSKEGMVGHFQPKCEEDGSFKKIQCHGSTGYCYCVAPDTGVKVEGTEVRGQPTTCETTGVNNAKKCLDELNELQAKPKMLGAFKPVCQENGLYAETQCHASYCYCVVPSTGEEILGTRIRFNKPKTCKATPCLMQRSEGLLKSKKGMVGHFQPQCEEDGSFKKIQCHGSTGFCFCVSPETGVKVEGTELRGKPKCETTVNEKKCLAQIKDLQSKPKLLGSFKPVCQQNGDYAETQCHAGYCYCVVPSTGEEILGTRVRFNRPKTCKATPCFMQRHHGLEDSAKGMTGQFQPACNPDGTFEKTQCHSSTGYCFCVIPETGERVAGTEVRFTKPKTCELTECMHQRSMALKSRLMGVFKPTCDADGAYTPTQCREGICYCVFPETGEQILGTTLPRGQKPVSCKVTECVQKRHDVLSAPKPMLGAFKPECAADGTYKPVQCHEGACYCVFKNTGKEVLGTMTRFSKPKSCKLTPCVLSRHKSWKLSSLGLLGVPIQRCDAFGKYDKVQCRKGLCWCVDPYTGKTIAGKSAQWTVPNCS